MRLKFEDSSKAKVSYFGRVKLTNFQGTQHVVVSYVPTEISVSLLYTGHIDCGHKMFCCPSLEEDRQWEEVIEISWKQNDFSTKDCNVICQNKVKMHIHHSIRYVYTGWFNALA